LLGQNQRSLFHMFHIPTGNVCAKISEHVEQSQTTYIKKLLLVQLDVFKA